MERGIPLIKISLRALLVLTVLTGLLYPAVMTLMGALFFPREAGGSLECHRGAIVGSRLIAQNMDDPAYFHPRPSAVTRAHPPSGASHWSPTSRDLRRTVAERRASLGEGAPFDLLTSSASGLDPHISKEAALFQMQRVAKARHLSPAERAHLERIVSESVEGPQWGFLGRERVSVLRLNLRLEEDFPR